MSDLKAIKCIKIDFGWGFAPDPAGGAYSASPDSLAGFKGLTSKKREGRGKEGKEGKEGEGEKVPRLVLVWGPRMSLIYWTPDHRKPAMSLETSFCAMVQMCFDILNRLDVTRE